MIVSKLIRLFPYIRRRRATLIAVLVMTLAASATAVLYPWPLKILIDYALGGEKTPAWLESFLHSVGAPTTSIALVILAGLASLFLFGVGAALDVGLSWGWMAAGQRMVYDLAIDLFARLQRLSLSFHSRHSVGDFLDRLTNDTWAVYSLTSQVLVSPIQQIFTLVGIGVVAWLLDPWLTVLSFCMAPILAASVRYFGPRLKRRAKKSREAQSRLTQFVHQTITSIPLVQAFSTEYRNQQHFHELVDDAVTASQQGVLVNKSFLLVNGLTNSLGRASVIFVGAIRVLQGSMTVGSLLVFLSYTTRLQIACRQLMEAYAKVKTSEASVDRVFEILDVKEEVSENVTAQPLSASPNSRGSSVFLENVTFGYTSGQAVLKDINLQVEAGENIALVGPTGAGKSTLTSLIPRFFDPTEGRVLINGQDLRKVTLDSLRSQIAIVLQEPFLMPMSVADNIAYGCPDATRKQIVAAAVAASADEFIQRLPEGYDSIIGERGSTLSGGQQQRLAIARALVKDASIVILDEPTSALDAATESKLLKALQSLTTGRTTFVIAHRLSTIRHVDRIVMLNQGRIVEVGSHEQLLASKGLYAEFYETQIRPNKKATAR